MRQLLACGFTATGTHQNCTRGLYPLESRIFLLQPIYSNHHKPQTPQATGLRTPWVLALHHQPALSSDSSVFSFSTSHMASFCMSHRVHLSDSSLAPFPRGLWAFPGSPPLVVDIQSVAAVLSQAAHCLCPLTRCATQEQPASHFTGISRFGKTTWNS